MLDNYNHRYYYTTKKNITESTSYRPDAEEGERSLMDREKSKDGKQDQVTRSQMQLTVVSVGFFIALGGGTNAGS